MCIFCKNFNLKTKLLNEKKEVENKILTDPYKENVIYYQLELENINNKILNNNERNRNKKR